MGVVEEFVCGGELGGVGFDIFALELVDHLEEVAGVPFEDWEDGTVAGWAVGSYEPSS